MTFNFENNYRQKFAEPASNCLYLLHDLQLCEFNTKKMKLTNIAILALKGSDQGIKERIAEATGVTASTVYRWINANSKELTLAASLKIIREETGLDDSLILEQETNATVNK